MSIVIYRVETPRGFSVDTNSVKHAISTLKMEELCSSETLVSTYKFQRHCNSRIGMRTSDLMCLPMVGLTGCDTVRTCEDILSPSSGRKTQKTTIDTFAASSASDIIKCL
jgi:hypothetical protein